MTVICNSAQLAQFAAAPNWTSASIPTEIKFSSWTAGDYSGWIMKSHVGTFKITGYDWEKMQLTIRKMTVSERTAFWLDTNSTLWRFGKNLVKRIVNTLKRLASLYSGRERQSVQAKRYCT